MDGRSYTTIARKVGASGGETFLPLQRFAEARYLRLIVDRPSQGGQTGGQMAVGELEIFGPAR